MSIRLPGGDDEGLLMTRRQSHHNDERRHIPSPTDGLPPPPLSICLDRQAQQNGSERAKLPQRFPLASSRPLAG